MDHSKHLLIVDDEANMRHMLMTILQKAGYRVEVAANGQEALHKVSAKFYDFILCDLRMPEMDGMTFLRDARAHIASTTVIVMSAYGTIDSALEAMKEGAYDYISKPFKPDEVHLVLRKAEERENLRRENTQLRQQITSIQAEHSFPNLVARSHAMHQVIRLAEKVAPFNTTVLITGESGTGKELIARGIHFASERAKGPWVPLNCGGIPENLLESELFGHRKGAFTGADRNRQGMFEEASAGTLFLDEIGELPLSLQVKLLRVLQENEIRPVGASRSKKINVRILAATAKDLEQQIAKGAFREDLYYRLNVVSITMPPLRDRLEDVPLLSDHFLRKYSKELKKEVNAISPEALNHLVQYQWSGNVRELGNVIERAVVLMNGPVLLPEHLPVQLLSGPSTCDMPDQASGYSLKTARQNLERELIRRALEKTGGNRTHAARLLEISHPSLLSKIKLYGLTL
jgi:two-component system response regulator AtoC